MEKLDLDLITCLNLNKKKIKKKEKKKREGMAHQAFIIEFLNLIFY